MARNFLAGILPGDKQEWSIRRPSQRTTVMPDTEERIVVKQYGIVAMFYFDSGPVSNAAIASRGRQSKL